MKNWGPKKLIYSKITQVVSDRTAFKPISSVSDWIFSRLYVRIFFVIDFGENTWTTIFIDPHRVAPMTQESKKPSTLENVNFHRWKMVNVIILRNWGLTFISSCAHTQGFCREKYCLIKPIDLENQSWNLKAQKNFKKRISLHNF